MYRKWLIKRRGAYFIFPVIGVAPIRERHLFQLLIKPRVDCKTAGFFLKISKEISKAWRKSLTRANRASVSPQSCSLFSASFHTFCVTARAYLNTQKYGLFCSLNPEGNIERIKWGPYLVCTNKYKIRTLWTVIWTWFQEFPYIKTLELTSWQRSYFSSDIKRRNKGGALVC